MIAFRYSLTIIVYSDALLSKLPGHPHLIIKSIIVCKLTSSRAMFLYFPLHISSKEIWPYESLDSYKDIGLILKVDILPAPLCIIPFRAGVADPVKMNCPVIPL